MIRPFFESCQVAEYRQEEVAFLFVKEPSSFPPGSEQGAFTKCSRKLRPHSSCCCDGTRFLLPPLRACPCVLNSWLRWWESLSRVWNFHGIKTGVQRLQSLPTPAVAEKGLAPPEKPVSITSMKTGKPSIPEHRRFRKEFRTTRNLDFGQRRGFAGISAKWHS